MSNEYWLVIGGIAQVLAAVFSIVVIFQSRRESVRPIIEIFSLRKKNHGVSDNRLRFELQIKNVGFDIARNFEVWYSLKSQLIPDECMSSEIKIFSKEKYKKILAFECLYLATKCLMPDKRTIARLSFDQVDLFEAYLSVKCCTRNHDYLTTRFKIEYKNGKPSYRLIHRRWDKKLILF